VILVGMFDSPFVRRVAVSLTLHGHAFEHRNWSVGADASKIKQYNPLGRVPALVLDDGEVLIESSAILDHLDEQAGPERALLPARGAERRRALRLIALALGAVEKGIQVLYENVFRPTERRHAPWVERCRAQVDGALRELDRECAALPADAWLLGPRLLQPDITLACVGTLLHDAIGLDLQPYPALARQVARCEALPVFRQFHVPYFTPTT
jgi:glutathione S-transferase